MDLIETRRETLPLATRLAPTSNIDVETRTAKIALSTGAGVQRYDWQRDRSYIEVLDISPAAVNMERLNGSGLPVLNNHDAWSGLDSILGRAEGGKIVDGELQAEVRFSKRDDVAGLVRDIADGIITDVSVGYTRDEMRMEPPKRDGEAWTYRVLRWTPLEVSFVTVPADPGAGLRNAGSDAAGSQPAVRTFPCEVRGADLQPVPAGAAQRKEVTMDQTKVEPVPATDSNAENTAAARAAAIVEERNRQRTIRSAVRAAGLDEAFADSLCDNEAITVDVARAQILDKLATRSAATPVRGVAHIEMGEDELIKVRNAVASAIVHRLTPTQKLDDNGAAEFRHMSLVRLGEELLERKGVKTRGLTRMQICARALSTSDFSNVLANVANKRLRMAYEQAPVTYRTWARRAPNAPDFKTITVAQVSAAPNFLLKLPGEELKYGSGSDGKETYAVATYARGLSFTREAMINDDLGSFDRMVNGFGNSAARLENQLVYLQLASNPTLADSVALFHSTHANYTSSGTVINVANLGVGRTAMRKQTGLQSEVLNVTPSFLIVPATQEALAYQYTSAQFVPAQSSNINEFRQGGRTALTPVVEASLDAITSIDGATSYASTTKWYLAADPNQIDTVEYCYLDGYEGVWIEQEIEFDTDAIKFKGRLDFAAKTIDYRGLYLNAGA